jgi:cytochrome c2
MSITLKTTEVILILLLSIACQSGEPKKGEVLFQTRGCSYCHTNGKGKPKGPDLKNVGERYNRAELQKWLMDPEIVYKEKARRPLNRGYSPMPRVVLTEQEINDLVAYLESRKH